MAFGDSFWSQLVVSFPLSVFLHMKDHEITFGQFRKMLKDFKDARNEIFQINWDNYTYRFKDVHGNEFKIGMHDDGEVHLWSADDTSLGHYHFDNDSVPSDEFINWLSQTTYNFTKGIIKCSGCGKEIRADEVAGQYFAGRYCKECWESKYREMEAKETYD